MSFSEEEAGGVKRLADELFAHLPPDEIDEDEPLEFLLVGGFGIRTASGTYLLRTADDGQPLAWRLRPLDDDRVEVVGYRNRSEVGRSVVPAATLTSDPEWS